MRGEIIFFLNVEKVYSHYDNISNDEINITSESPRGILIFVYVRVDKNVYYLVSTIKGKNELPIKKLNS